MSQRWRDSSWIWLLALGVFASRIAFLQPGFGADPDSWRIANAARHIATEGTYQPSRLPGYPLVEGVYAILWSSGGRAAAFNTATAALSALGAAVFALYLRRLHSRDYLWGGIALAFTPLYYINSTNSMDYMWSLTFLLLATYFASESRSFPSGICLGLGIASRLTAGAMLIPLCLMLASGSRLSLRNTLLLVLPAAIVGAVAYLPVIFLHGLGGFAFVDGPQNPLEVAYLISFGVWGVIGVLALLTTVIWALRARSSSSAAVRGNRPLLASWIVAVVLFTLAFLRLPQEAGYMLPAVPFVILILGRCTTSPRFRIVCVALTLSPFLLSIDRNGIHADGAILHDHAVRKDGVGLVERAIHTGEAATTRTVVIAGWYLPMIEAQLGSDVAGKTRYVGLLDSGEVARYRKEGYDMYYLPPIRRYALQVHGIDLDAAGVSRLDASDGGVPGPRPV